MPFFTVLMQAFSKSLVHHITLITVSSPPRERTVHLTFRGRPTHSGGPATVGKLPGGDVLPRIFSANGPARLTTGSPERLAISQPPSSSGRQP